MKKLYVLLAAVLALAIFAGFALCRPQKSVYGKEDTDIAVKAGAAFTIELAENPTTGYGWQYTLSDPGIAAVQDDEYVPDDASERLTGSGGTRILTFKALEKGTATIDFVYTRSWESSPYDEQITFTVHVR